MKAFLHIAALLSTYFELGGSAALVSEAWRSTSVEFDDSAVAQAVRRLEKRIQNDPRLFRAFASEADFYNVIFQDVTQ